jgi:hypothetical protein
MQTITIICGRMVAFPTKMLKIDVTVGTITASPRPVFSLMSIDTNKWSSMTFRNILLPQEIDRLVSIRIRACL